MQTLSNLAVVYLRVSTARQGQSGLGLEAQQKAVSEFLMNGNWLTLAEFTEIETGKRKDRPQLQAALELCRKRRATLVIAKLDRLARNVSFVSGLLESKVRFIAADMPDASREFLQMASVFAEWEATRISERTKAALAAAKARGQPLGWSIPGREGQQQEAARRGRQSGVAAARRRAENLLPLIEKIRGDGKGTLERVAAELNARGVPTARGGQWHPTTVRNVLAYVSQI